MVRTPTRPTGFSLDVPESWIEFDIWRATRTGDLARLVDARIHEHPELAPERGPLLKLLREVAAEAERNEAVYCATLSEVVEPAGSGGRSSDDGVLAATAMVFHTRGSFDERQNTAEAIASQVTAMAPVNGSPHWRIVELVELPAGRAARTRGVERVTGRAQSADLVMMQTLVPVPGGDGVLNVALTSPQVDLAEPMLHLFDAITSTLAWTS